MIIEIIILLVTVITFNIWYAYKRSENYFDENNVKYVKGWPLFGNLLLSSIQMKHTFDDIDMVYRAFPKERYVGIMQHMNRELLIRDPELIKLITVKDFDHFTDHKDFFSEYAEPLLGSSLVSMKGEKWRHLRTVLSAAFTGSKMKHMMQYMVDIGKNTIDYLKEHKNEDINVDDIIRRYTNDVIASTNFGLEVNSLKDRNNEFFKIGQTALNFGVRQIVVIYLDEVFPRLVKALGLTVYPQSTYDFFTNTIMNTVAYRKANNVSRPDMIQLLMDTPIEWTPNQLSAQAFLFFAAGFETSASTVVLALHELTLNPETQEKLYQEIKNFKETNGDIYNNMVSLNYLDCVINETLRKWSPSIILDRKCVKTYQLPPPSEGGKPFILKPGDVVINSSNSLHLDPQYWPDPLKFDPDRWSNENKHNIKPCTYTPFGSGPRLCIGNRYALMVAKVLLYYLMLNFKMQKCQKTTDPIELVPYGFEIKAHGGTWLRFEERNEN